MPEVPSEKSEQRAGSKKTSVDRDRIFAEPREPVPPFEFNEAVAAVFDDMLNRSIPRYSELQGMILDWIGYFHRPGTHVYDLGCSTGNLLLGVLRALPRVESLYGIDKSPAMLARAKEKLRRVKTAASVDLVCDDLAHARIENASVVILNYTLQFVDPERRPKLIRRIHRALVAGGALILSEKLEARSACMGVAFTEMYERFKKGGGYSELEISQKRKALEKVLVPFDDLSNLRLLTDSGFPVAECFFRWNNFASFLAVKA